MSRASGDSSLGDIADNCAERSDNAIKEHNSVLGRDAADVIRDERNTKCAAKYHRESFYTFRLY